MSDYKSFADKTMVIILAAGKGARIGRTDFAKVCMAIDGVPAINRLIGAFKKRGFSHFAVVVGDKASQVIETIEAQHPGVLYIYQRSQEGTGHAARLASDALRHFDPAGHILVTMGDKYLDPQAIDMLVNGFIKQHADMALLTIPKTRLTAPSGGRVFLDASGQALDIIEKTDLAKQALADDIRHQLRTAKPLTGQALLQLIQKHLPNPKKQATAAADLLEQTAFSTVNKQKIAAILDTPAWQIVVAGKSYTAAQIEKICKAVNPSFYLFRTPAFHHGVSLIDNKNAQKEYYITDIIRLLADVKNPQGGNLYRIRTVPIDQPQWLQGFNSPDELLAIQDYVHHAGRTRRPDVTRRVLPDLRKNQYNTVRQWREKFEAKPASLTRWLKTIYGPDQSLHQRKIKEIIRVLNCYGRQFGDDHKVCIVRAPGRLNLMGRHIDNRGGFNNFLAIDRETIAVAGLRDDDSVFAVNTQPEKFPPIDFNIGQVIGAFEWGDWFDFINSDWVRQQIYRTAGHWGNYIKAAILRLQHQYQDIKIKGVNLAITGDVPIGAGLSSSSTLVVATLQAAIALNNFELTSRQFIDLCGQGEWFTGARDDAGASAAISIAARGKIVQVGYFPFTLGRTIDAPADYQLILADSRVEAPRQQQSRDTFNARIAASDLALALLKQRSPEIADAIEHVRDLDTEKLACQPSDIYRLLLKVPTAMTRRQLSHVLTRQYRPVLEQALGTHAEPKFYPLRGVLLYGIAEIQRAKIAIDWLAGGRVEPFGRLMAVSHDGDRVARPGRDGKYHPVDSDCDDDLINRLINNLGSQDPDKVLNAQLYMQPGRYACSTPQIDQMIDIVTGVPGVAGSQIAGAGLGGCIMILARPDSVPALRAALTRDYYRPKNLTPAIIPCSLTAGAGLIQF